MRLVDWRHVVMVLGVAALGCAYCALAAAADKPGYGKVDTFEPGKKYSCVPTPDHKGWDCTQSGKAADAPPPSATPEPPAAAPAVARSAPAASAPATAAPVSTAAPPTPAAAHSGELPNYLSARAASGAPPPQQPMPAPAPAARANVSTNPQVSSPPPREESKPAEVAAAPVSTPSAEPSTSVAATPAKSPPAAEPAPVAAPAPAKTAVSEKPETAPTPAPQPAAPAPAEPVRPATAPVAMAPATPAHGDIPALGSDAFLALSGEQYVIELAHAASEAGLAAPPPLPRGEVYKLHLQQNGGDVWLLLWGSFDDVSAARAARAELAASAAQTPGWPRRVAPLQAEARRARD